MKSILLATALSCSALFGSACQASSVEDEAAIQQRLEQKGAAAVLEEVARAAYQPPADGLLTEDQVAMYFAVREREQQIREVAAHEEAARKVDDLATADLRAAQELGYNPKEYQWVQERVLEARMAWIRVDMERRLAAGREAYLARLEAQRADSEGARRAEIEAKIQRFREDIATAKPQVPPVLQQNVDLLARYEDRLGPAEERFALERQTVEPAGEREATGELR